MMAAESEIEVCPFCATDAVVVYDRRRDINGGIKAESRLRVHCPNPACPGYATNDLDDADG
jgi:hypothetical protein